MSSEALQALTDAVLAWCDIVDAGIDGQVWWDTHVQPALVAVQEEIAQ